MIQINEKQDCCGCQACAQICPKNCISMYPDHEGFYYPNVQKNLCIDCGLCKKVCPMLYPMQKSERLPEAYAAWNLDETVRIHSSSGGIFPLLAEWILQQDGTVYGAAMENRCVRHIRVQHRDELPRLCGSKYVQSDVKDTYRQASKDLDKGKAVLYTGTPCQIEGLQKYLGRQRENLICMDIVCHGVPSPMVWNRYVSFREETADAVTETISFREKQDGWKNYSMFITFINQHAYRKKHSDDPFMRAYLHNLSIRPSCYDCRFRKVNRCSDITVADFWGIEHICPEMDDDKGTSLVIVHSEKGQQIFSEIKDRICSRPVDYYAAIQYNPSMTSPVAKPEMRDLFLQAIQNEPFDKVADRYAKKRHRGICRILKRIFSDT